MYIAIILIQLLVSVVVGLYFLRAMRRERQIKELTRMEKIRLIGSNGSALLNCYDR